MTCFVTERSKIKSFTDLQAWKASHEVAVSIYRVTKGYPKDELFGITNQMRRASVSVGSNIAEGFSRQGVKEKAQFYSIAKGSLTELESQILISYDIGFLSKTDLELLQTKVQEAGKLITGLIKYIHSLS